MGCKPSTYIPKRKKKKKKGITKQDKDKKGQNFSHPLKTISSQPIRFILLTIQAVELVYQTSKILFSALNDLSTKSSPRRKPRRY